MSESQEPSDQVGSAPLPAATAGPRTAAEHPVSPAPTLPGGLTVPEQLSWFLLLLPGFVLVSVMGVVTERPEWSELEFTAYSLIGSVLCLGLTLPIYLLGRFAVRVTRNKSRAKASPTSHALPAAFVLLNFALAAVLGGAVGVALEKDAAVNAVNRTLGLNLDKRSWMRPLKYVLQHNHFGKLRELGIDGRTPALKQPKVYVRLAFKEGPTYEGWPFLLPHGNAKTEIFLSPACRQVEKGKEFELIQGPGVLLPLDEYLSIELIDRAGSGCFAQVKAQATCKSCASCVQSVADQSVGGARPPCGSCAEEAEGFATSALIEPEAHQQATATAKACGSFAHCRVDSASPACQQADVCVAAAKALSPLVPGCTTSVAAPPRPKRGRSGRASG